MAKKSAPSVKGVPERKKGEAKAAYRKRIDEYKAKGGKMNATEGVRSVPAEKAAAK